MWLLFQQVLHFSSQPLCLPSIIWCSLTGVLREEREMSSKSCELSDPDGFLCRDWSTPVAVLRVFAALLFISARLAWYWKESFRYLWRMLFLYLAGMLQCSLQLSFPYEVPCRPAGNGDLVGEGQKSSAGLSGCWGVLVVEVDPQGGQESGGENKRFDASHGAVCNSGCCSSSPAFGPPGKHVSNSCLIF